VQVLLALLVQLVSLRLNDFMYRAPVIATQTTDEIEHDL
jgi:hypothetical protein